MSIETPECWRCSLYKGEVALLRAEIAGLRNSILSLTRRPADGTAVFEILGMDEAERLAFSGPFAAAPDVWYRVSLTYRDQLSVCCGIPMDDPSALLTFFEDLAKHKLGWQGEKKVAIREGQLAITCTYERKQFRPEVSMDVYVAVEIPSFHPYWSVQLHFDVDPDLLESMAKQARAVFARAMAEALDAADRNPPDQR